MWKNFELFALISLVSWVLGIILFFIKTKKSQILAEVFVILGILSLSVFITILWISLERPPLRTLGETRLWYSLFISVIGYVMHKRWKYTLFIAYALGMGILFVLLNYLNPDIHNKALMPALQSVWFVPHVIVYIAAYAFLGFSCVMGIVGLYQMYKKQDELKTLDIAENMIYIGYGFLTLGLLFGALWAKEAWGHYWTWDPKETWALLTWGTYLVFIHLKINKSYSSRFYLQFIALAFIILLISWFGINYLPSAQNSIHVYAN